MQQRLVSLMRNELSDLRDHAPAICASPGDCRKQVYSGEDDPNRYWVGAMRACFNIDLLEHGMRRDRFLDLGGLSPLPQADR